MRFLHLLFLALLLPAFAPVLGAAVPDRPNIVILLADDLRPDGLGALGNPVVKTPNLDALVTGGFAFRRAYTLGSMIGAVCLPSRTMLLSGQSAFRAASLASRKTGPASGSAPDAFTFPRAMKAAGYATMHTGKFGNSPKPITDEFDETSDPGDAAAVADRAVDFIRRKAGVYPLFLYVAGSEPHDPQNATPEFYARYRPENEPAPVAFQPYHPFDNGEMTVRDEKTLPWPRTQADLARKLARYHASTAYWDEQMGRIIAALRAAGQINRTIFVIAGDNGLSLGEHGLLGKQNLYEFGGMHVPLVFSGHGIAPGNSRAIAYLMDVFPTVCDLAGIPIPARVEGRSLAPVLRGEAKSVRDLGFTFYRDCQRSVSDDRWKLIRYPLIGKTQLFDLEQDPHEEHDLAADPAQAERIGRLLAKLAELQKDFGDPHPLSVPQPAPAEWSPAKLTEADLAAQRKETEVSSTTTDWAKKKQKQKPQPGAKRGADGR